MNKQMLTEAQWERIVKVLPNRLVKRAKEYRQFVEAVLYLAHTGCPWRTLPCELGHWHTLYVRFVRWEAYGIWHQIFEVVQGEHGLAALFVEYRFAPACMCIHAAEAPRKTLAIRRRIPRCTTCNGK